MSYSRGLKKASGSYLKKWNREKGAFESINSEFNDLILGEKPKLEGYPVKLL
ncbi:hypothetical protein N9890_00140 [Akkermansiaceae bacterium]|nr:hypothetical protein [bacterium]MDB4294312.1 hypothetical protein [Akkermansiaceae bacterium]MDB4820675.1 hypothetical protein [Akkermansiaceae bacterium]